MDCSSAFTNACTAIGTPEFVVAAVAVRCGVAVGRGMGSGVAVGVTWAVDPSCAVRWEPQEESTIRLSADSANTVWRSGTACQCAPAAVWLARRPAARPPARSTSPRASCPSPSCPTPPHARCPRRPLPRARYVPFYRRCRLHSRQHELRAAVKLPFPQPFRCRAPRQHCASGGGSRRRRSPGATSATSMPCGQREGLAPSPTPAP